MPVRYAVLSEDERFWMKVNKDDEAHPGCWMWTGGTMASGYGHFRYEGKWQGSHVISWQLVHGPIPEGAVIRHKKPCENKACVNPEHLELGHKGKWFVGRKRINWKWK